MEKLDLVIAVAGALILALAVTGVVLTGGEPPLRPHEVALTLEPLKLGEGNEAHFNEARFTDVFTFDVTNETPLTGIFVNASVDFLGATGPAVPTMHLVLRAPNGTEHSADGEPAPGGTAGASRLGATMVVTLAPPPPSGLTVRAADEEAAREAALAQVAREGVGTWTLELHYSSGLSPTTSATVAWRADASAVGARAEG